MRGAILALLLVSIMILGCTGQGSANANVSANISNPSGGSMENNTGGNGNHDLGGTMVNATVNTSTGGNTGNSGSGGSQFGGMDYAALVALGVPLQCAVTTVANGTPTTIKMYLKGSEMIRTEVPTKNSKGCQVMAVIQKDKKMYMGCSSGEAFMPGSECDWLLFAPTPGQNGTMTTQVQTTGGSSVDTDFGDLAPSQIDCKAWVYDSSKFETVGKVCSFDQIVPSHSFG